MGRSLSLISHLKSVSCIVKAMLSFCKHSFYISYIGHFHICFLACVKLMDFDRGAVMGMAGLTWRLRLRETVHPWSLWLIFNTLGFKTKPKTCVGLALQAKVHTNPRKRADAIATLAISSHGKLRTSFTWYGGRKWGETSGFETQHSSLKTAI